MDRTGLVHSPVAAGHTLAEVGHTLAAAGHTFVAAGRSLVVGMTQPAVRHTAVVVDIAGCTVPHQITKQYSKLCEIDSVVIGWNPEFGCERTAMTMYRLLYRRNWPR
jgi:hypothetical protein